MRMQPSARARRRDPAPGSAQRRRRCLPTRSPEATAPSSTARATRFRCRRATCAKSTARRSSSAIRSSIRTGSSRRHRSPHATASARCSTRGSCSGCHFKDGRGRPPEPGEPMDTMLLRISVPGADAHGAPLPEPGCGDQIQGQSIPGVAREADVFVGYDEVAGAFADREVFSLRRPSYRIEHPGYGPIAQPLLMSPRVSPGIVGLGLLEAVPDATLSASPIRTMRTATAISGRVNMVWNHVTSCDRAPAASAGRPSSRTVLQQTGGGVHRRHRDHVAAVSRRESHRTARTCRGAAPSRSEPEVGEQIFQAVGALRAQPRRARGPHRRRSASASRTAAACRRWCAACHVPELKTGAYPGAAGARESDDPRATPILLAARHGRRPRRRPAGVHGHRTRVANAAAVGPRSGREGQRPHVPAARRPARETPPRRSSGTAAKRAGRGSAFRDRRQDRIARAARVSELALTMNAHVKLAACRSGGGGRRCCWPCAVVHRSVLADGQDATAGGVQAGDARTTSRSRCSCRRIATSPRDAATSRAAADALTSAPNRGDAEERRSRRGRTCCSGVAAHAAVVHGPIADLGVYGRIQFWPSRRQSVDRVLRSAAADRRRLHSGARRERGRPVGARDHALRHAPGRRAATPRRVHRPAGRTPAEILSSRSRASW